MPNSNNPFDQLIARSQAYRNVLEVASKIASHKLPILIEGEQGVGKERLARAIHLASPRAQKDFVVIDCSSYSDIYLESEIFGYLRGSFAGAIHDKKGLLEIADGGTVFLDHISKTKPSFQGKLLRVLNDGNFHKLGGVAEIHVDVRFILATEIDLKNLVKDGKFREDLYYQLHVMKITIPPLRERREDILPLAQVFSAEASAREGISNKTFSKGVVSLLENYNWPGNLSQLEKEIEKCVVLAGEGKEILPSHTSAEIKTQRRVKSASDENLGGALKEQKKRLIESLEKDAIKDALKKCQKNRTHAAELLKISRQELLRKIRTYKIK